MPYKDVGGWYFSFSSGPFLFLLVPFFHPCNFFRKVDHFMKLLEQLISFSPFYRDPTFV
jgi:hypothetical protein